MIYCEKCDYDEFVILPDGSVLCYNCSHEIDNRLRQESLWQQFTMAMQRDVDETQAEFLAATGRM